MAFRYFEKQHLVEVCFLSTEYSRRRLDVIGREHTDLTVLSYRCSSGHAVQCLAEFETSAALQWLGATGPASLLERTGLAEPGASLRSARILNVTLGGKAERRGAESETFSFSQVCGAQTGAPLRFVGPPDSQMVLGPSV